jgi:hypothetical protein
MTRPDDLIPVEIPVEDAEEDTWREAARVTQARDWEANEADLIEQAIAVPDDDRDGDR